MLGNGIASMMDVPVTNVRTTAFAITDQLGAIVQGSLTAHIPSRILRRTKLASLASSARKRCLSGSARGGKPSWIGDLLTTAMR